MRRLVVALSVALVASVAPSCGGGDDEERVVTVAFLRAVPADDADALFDELREAGFVAGANLRILPDDHLGETHPDPDDAEAAVRAWTRDGADVVFAFSTTGAAAAAAATSTVPILFLVNDPMAVGLVADEGAPEANLTGVTFRVPADRTVELARRAIPHLSSAGFLFPAGDAAAVPHREAMMRAATGQGVELVAAPFSGRDDVPRALDGLVAAGVDAVFVANAPTAVRALDVIEPAVAGRGLPLVANVDVDFAPTALVAVAPDTGELQAQLGRQAVRLLEGARPGTIPVEEPRRFRVTVNLRQAQELGLPPLPEALLRVADRVVR